MNLVHEVERAKSHFSMDEVSIARNMIKLNRFRIRHPDHELEKLYGYVFFTRPDINLIKDDGMNITDECFKLPMISDIYNSRDIELIRNLKISAGGVFVNPITNFAESLEFSDTILKTRVSAETSTDWKITFGGRLNESRASNTFNIQYHDDRNLTVYKLHQVWIEYINAATMGRVKPKREHILKRVIDYACSAYMFLVAEDGVTIKYYGKYIGVFPTNLPDSVFNWNEGDSYKKLDLTIQYQYSFFDPMNPIIINEFNRIARPGNVNGQGATGELLPIYNPGTATMGPTWANSVGVVRKKDNAGVFDRLELHWYK